MDKLLKDIKDLKIQGATEVAKAGLMYIKKVVERTKSKNKEELKQELLREINTMRKIRPTEPALFNVLTSIFVKFEKAEISSVENMKNYLYRICEEKITEIDSLLEKVSKIASKDIQNGDTILTHCHSNTLMSVFKKAVKDGKHFKVIVTETRPLFQGLKTAKELLAVGVETIYCVDAAMGYVMKDANKVFVGCDAIFYDGSIINKIGTFPMAIVAKQFGKPFYVVGETIKITEKVDIEQRSPDEVIDPRKLSGAKIINPAFDVTPSDFITAIITERGKVSPEMIRKILI
jgi:ribose 1,5-bisphosphate isomerase